MLKSLVGFGSLFLICFGFATVVYAEKRTVFLEEIVDLPFSVVDAFFVVDGEDYLPVRVPARYNRELGDEPEKHNWFFFARTGIEDSSNFGYYLVIFGEKGQRVVKYREINAQHAASLENSQRELDLLKSEVAQLEKHPQYPLVASVRVDPNQYLAEAEKLKQQLERFASLSKKIGTMSPTMSEIDQEPRLVEALTKYSAQVKSARQEAEQRQSSLDAKQRELADYRELSKTVNFSVLQQSYKKIVERKKLLLKMRERLPKMPD